MEEGYGYRKLIEELGRLSELFPFLHVESIGQSVMGRELPAIRIGTGSKEIQYNAAMHANEWITTPLLMRFLEEIAYALRSNTIYRGKDMQRIFSETSLWLVPMLNPDGIELVQKGPASNEACSDSLITWNGGLMDFRNWKSNIRGVDLNDQFPAHWEEEQTRRGTKGPGARDYGGQAPLTEPEALALARFTYRHNFQLIIALHTQGREIYWNYRGLEPPCAQGIAELFEQVSGYRAVKLTDSDAGYKDWFIQEFGRPGFTVEVGLGRNPLSVVLFPELYGEVVSILLEGLEV